MTALEYHPLANLFPLIEGSDFEEFCAGIKADGILHDKIVLLDGKILDGRNRYRACQATGVTPHFETYNATIHGDPLKYVIGKNLHRRHLTNDQRRMVAGRLATMGPGRPGEETFANGEVKREDAAQLLSVDVAGVDRAKVVIARGAEELQNAVDAGEITVRAAADITKLTPDEQRDLVERADPQIVKDVARKIREGDVNGARSIMASRVEPDDSLDYFPTPPWATRALVRHVLPRLGVTDILTAWDPACGEGHMTGVLEESVRGPVIGSDIFDYSRDGRMPPCWWRVLDFLKPEDATDGTPVVDWIISNPPFGDLTERFVLRAFDLAQVGVAMFVRLQWLETVGRYWSIFSSSPPTIIAFFAERVNLCKGRWEPNGSTATAYVWLVWLKSRTPRPPIWIPPDCRKTLTRSTDAERFTARPVAPMPPDGRALPASPEDEDQSRPDPAGMITSIVLNADDRPSSLDIETEGEVPPDQIRATVARWIAAHPLAGKFEVVTVNGKTVDLAETDAAPKPLFPAASGIVSAVPAAEEAAPPHAQGAASHFPSPGTPGDSTGGDHEVDRAPSSSAGPPASYSTHDKAPADDGLDIPPFLRRGDPDCVVKDGGP